MKIKLGKNADNGNGERMIKNPLNKTQIVIGLALLLMLGGMVPVSIWLNKGMTTAEEVHTTIAFSQTSGFYDNDVTLWLSASEKGEILYTLDGSIPGQDNEAALSYSPETGIFLECGEEEKVYTVRAALVSEDENREQAASKTCADICTETYIVGEQVQSRYDLQVLAIAGSPEDLTGEENGIFAAANRELRGRDSERAVQITLFDAQGNVKLSQNCGVRINGARSRGRNQPSLRLYARSEYDEQKNFNALLFEDYNYENALITGCKQITVRNGGNDHGYAHLRNEFALRLSTMAGYPDASASSPVCVYVNGEYYGVYWLLESYDSSYFEKKYGEYDGEMVTLEGIVAYMEPDEADDELTAQMKEEYNALHEYVAYADLNDETNWEALNEAIDVENYLQYVAIQNYFVNSDVFLNNFKAYRYYSPSGEYQEGTVFDGRYRFLLYDLDQTLAFGFYDETVAEANILSTSNRVNYDIFYNALFANIVSTQEGRDYYIRYYLSLLNYYFSEEQAVPILDEMHESHAAELQKFYEQPELIAGNIETPEGADYSHVLQEVDEIKTFLAQRPGWALIDLEEAFDLDSRYTLSVENQGEANLTVDFATFHDTSYTGTYFGEVPVTVTAEPKCGDRFDYWLVDGVEYYDTTLTITEDMIQDDVLYLECVTSPDPEAGLLISAVKSRGGSDYMELTNFGTQTVNLAAYLLADNDDGRNQSTLPAIEVAPGETITVYCANYTGAEAIGKPGVGFNIKAGETVYLYRDGLRQKVAVPKLGTRDGVYRMNPYSGIFYEEVS
jgi:hypothetical protein